MKRDVAHMKVDNPWSGATICGQSGNPTIVFWGNALGYGLGEFRAVARRVTCRKCRKILKPRLGGAR